MRPPPSSAQGRRGGGDGRSSPSSPRGGRGSSSPAPSSAAPAASKNFKVVVRVRPPVARELGAEDGNFRSCVRVDPRRSAVEICMNAGEKDGSGAPFHPVHRFTFDAVFRPGCGQGEVYAEAAAPLVDAVLGGFNATVLAYGQTGAGKTFTMEGFEQEEMRGIIPRSITHIFDHIRGSTSPGARFLVRASYVQIYNDVISDLLKPERGALQIREDKKRGVFVGGLSEWVVRSPREVYGLIRRGSALRATSATKMNEVSSRSHALFIVIVEQQDVVKAPNGAGPPRKTFRVGKLNLVDLAGSERVRQSGATGQRLEESKNINQSLSALGNVIAALTDRKRRPHVPYRDSKLTRILEDSLGGNCKTTMMAMVSPALDAFPETLSTVKFANRAKNIRNVATVNEDVDEKTLLRRYERELKRLREELGARKRNVVDKSVLVGLEQEKRQAEADRVSALERLSSMQMDLAREKRQKKELEARIRSMNAQMMDAGGSEVSPSPSPRSPGGGHEMRRSGDGKHGSGMIMSNPAFQRVLKREQEQIRTEYERKIEELERERVHLGHENKQVGRYKALLLRQRDIMIQLTARLNERDQSIIALTEELESYDRHHYRLDLELDQRAASLAALQGGGSQQSQSQSQSQSQQQQQQQQPVAAPAAAPTHVPAPVSPAPSRGAIELPSSPRSSSASPAPSSAADDDSRSSGSSGAAASASADVVVLHRAAAASPDPLRDAFGEEADVRELAAALIQRDQEREELLGRLERAEADKAALEDQLEDSLQQRVEQGVQSRLEQLQAQVDEGQAAVIMGRGGRQESAALVEEAGRAQADAARAAAEQARAEQARAEAEAAREADAAAHREAAERMRRENAELRRAAKEAVRRAGREAAARAEAARRPLEEENRRLAGLSERQAHERRSLQTILERKMKAIVDGIAAGGDRLEPRTAQQVALLQRIVDASVSAMRAAEQPANTTATDLPAPADTRPANGALSGSGGGGTR